jgi:ABC-type branched-subunit amino acid transport system substrate-binding protein
VHDPSRYDLVVVGGPVWFGNLATPTRAYLEAHARRATKLAFFVTMNGSGERRALAQMAEAAGAAPLETASFTRKDLERRGASAAVATFVSALRQQAAEARAHEIRGPALY